MKSLTIVACFLVAACAMQAQPYSARSNFGARLEPQGGLMHGAGQDANAFAQYWRIMAAGRQPTVYMHYIDLRDLQASWADDLKAQLTAYPGVFIIPQVGLNMTTGVTDHYEAQVAAGAYDQQIANLVEGLRRLALPVYLRIGYEFNGLTWNGYQPVPYQQAFIRITNALRAANLEVATVWDMEIPDGVSTYFDYYPGDQYVDWFGINIFQAKAFQDSTLSGVFAQARARKKPVMMGEETGFSVGAQNGATSWNGWYAQFFSFLQANPEVKQFNYIDWNWANYPQWSTWGDARLELDTATYVRNLYLAQLADPVYLHAGSETAFRKTLAYNDSTAPLAVTDLTAVATSGGITLNWTAAQDPSGIARYYLYRNGALLAYCLGPGFVDTTATPGTASYSVAAMDRAGNLSASSNVALVTVKTLEKLTNGGFESGLTGWEFDSFDPGAVGSAVVDSTNPMAGTGSVRLSVSKTTGTAWHLQLRQYFNIRQGLTYTVRLTARASAPVSLPDAIQQTGSPYTTYASGAVNLGTDAKTIQFSYVATVSMAVELEFNFANIGTTTVWLDDISVQESDPGHVAASTIAMVNTSWGGADIAQNTFIEVKGTNLVPATTPAAGTIWSNAPDFASGKMPTNLDGVSVTVNGKPAFVYFYCSAVTSTACATDQIDVLTPLDSSTGPVQVVVTSGSTVSTSFTVNMKAVVPTFLLFNALGPVVATHSDYSLLGAAALYPGATTPAKPGEAVVLYAIGFGLPVNLLVNGSSSQAGSLPSAPVCQVGGLAASAIATLISPGLYQVNLTIPPGAPSGDDPIVCTYNNGATTPAGDFISVQK
jgi:uncharacterized protein (TIGR03437 family)